MVYLDRTSIFESTHVLRLTSVNTYISTQW